MRTPRASRQSVKSGCRTKPFARHFFFSPFSSFRLRTGPFGARFRCRRVSFVSRKQLSRSRDLIAQNFSAALFVALGSVRLPGLWFTRLDARRLLTRAGSSELKFYHANVVRQKIKPCNFFLVRTSVKKIPNTPPDDGIMSVSWEGGKVV